MLDHHVMGLKGIDEGMPDTLDNKINFSKLRVMSERLSDAINELQDCQERSPVPILSLDPEYQAFLNERFDLMDVTEELAEIRPTAK